MSNNNDAAIALLEKHFDIAFTAPDGIKKFRELILSLAMQGKLVPQDPSDQPASELLKEIEAEKNRLVKEGKIKKSQPLPELKPDEIPYELPKGWEWSRLGEIVSLLGDGIHGTPIYDETGDYFFINGNNLSDGIIEFKENTKKVSINEYQKYKKELNSRTVLVSINGTIGNVAFYNNEKVILGKSACYFNLFEQIDKQFTKRLLNSKYFLEYAFVSATGSTIKNVSLKSMREFTFPLPPLAEQRRIVAKIDELMARCDELEKLRGNRDRKQITVHNSALNRLLIAEQQSEFNTAWQFITQHFRKLYSVKENVTELRKAMLQLAVMGKLVPQDPNDQPASELLKQLRKARLGLYEGKHKNNPETKTMLRKLNNLGDVTLPFELPNTWLTVHLIDCCEYLVDCHNKTATYKDSGIPIIRTTNIRDRQVQNEGMKYVNKDTYEFWARRCPPQSGDIIFTREAPMGEAAIIPEGMTCCLGQRTMLIRTMQDFIYNKYLLITLTEPGLLERASTSAIGSTVKHLRVGDVEELNIPLPPLAEQRRIVAKIDQLMALCDNLEKQIDNADSKQTNLLNAVMTKI